MPSTGDAESGSGHTEVEGDVFGESTAIWVILG